METKRRPDIVYKYFPPERFTFFFKPLVRFTPLSELNDPFEGRTVFGTVSLNLDEFKQKGELFIRRAFGAKNRHPSEIESVVDKFKLSPQEVFEAINQFLMPAASVVSRSMFDNKGLAVFSLSLMANHELMWSHYAKDHKGFAIGFDCSHPFFDHEQQTGKYSLFGSKPVMYLSERPQISMLEAEEQQIPLYMGLFTKSRAWEYEQEWRVIISEVEKINKFGVIGLVEMPLEAIKEVRIGFKAAPQVEANAKNFCREYDISLLHGELHPQKWELMFEEVAL